MQQAIEQLYQKVFSSLKLDDKQTSLCYKACEMAIKAQELPEKGVVRSFLVAEVLAPLKLDEETLIATLLSDANLTPFYPCEKIAEEYSEQTAHLVRGIRRLNQFKEFDLDRKDDDVQNERLRQMLLAMTSDIRIMIVKLAYRVVRMRELKHESDEIKQQIAAETELIFAPLANRLGIAQLKWELEDLSFRYLEPQKYKEIASKLRDKRSEREEYIKLVIETIDNMLKEHGIKADISGRPKHIFSIWKKMHRKNLPIEELYDLRAVRIYVDSVQMCYETLGLIHSRWSYVRHEFDDYITTPKENGYQSIHTVIIGPEGKTVEIQIRTPDMHHNAEYGIAAHWRYKEGGHSNFDESLERSIANIRQLLENSNTPDLFKEISTELQTKHIYVMTPQNEIVTLRQGSTPLDFAYQIHTELGHRCRGAKINGRIQPLSYVLQTGDKVEVLTIKNGEPSRNWLNPNLGYLTSSSARNKVRSWFNKQNKSENTSAGEALFHKEIKRLHAESIDSKKLLQRFKYDTLDLLYEDIGKGRLNERQITNAIQDELRPNKTQSRQQQSFGFPAHSEEEAVAYVVGAVHLTTHLAPCCQPKPFDDIVGFVTRGRGVTIHHRECANILNLSHEDRRRLIDVSWDKDKAEQPCFLAELQISAFDRKGLLRDVMTKLTDMDINLIASNTKTNTQEHSVTMILTLELDYATNLGDLLDQVELIPNIESVSIKT
ncbi:RelA/SpoT family protein [Thiomicrorhabdus sediminis]|uniref:GTP pyrophosphokinase n=1 Tax=Thiomicrorhabdus sediminis TaxID=2580412 RepID=A0A4P9K582_9GAMM|nr:bifunctional (p)ppGpp synthetase/guanosine-3',5'-bis(diphosphate) 3'-pyrophosphohydrolase [Thiomicrorhabdus sediminis]QCU90132.1 bifunctional (p)ppGpp synthetase/guanosine-3',5'-bis(diphosphate) 3'-pyrophosphohydrolase [Thiomicrorhabdus sediminis]